MFFFSYILELDKDLNTSTNLLTLQTLSPICLGMFANQTDNFALITIYQKKGEYSVQCSVHHIIYVYINF